VTRAAGRSADLSLDLLARDQQIGRVVVGLDLDAGVEELGLVDDQPDRLGVVDRRCPDDGNAVSRERVDGGLQVVATVPDIGAEAEVPAVAGGWVGGNNYASRQTSTATSPTGSAIGGSGLAAFTQTACSS
jgi:hypothetical protein